MKIWAIVAGSVLAAGVLPIAANATPVDEAFSASNVYGITGYILTPSAAVLPSGCVDLGAHFVHGPHIPVTLDDTNGTFFCPDVVIPHISVGLFNHLEIGGADRIILAQPAGVDNDDIYGNAKFRATGLRNPLQIAAGVQDFTNNVDRTEYAVGTLHLGNLSMTHSGYLRALRRVEVGGGYRFSEAFGSNPFVNGGIGLGSVVQLMAEWNPEQKFDTNNFVCVSGTVNAGARIALSKIGGPLGRVPAGVMLDIDGIGLDEEPTYAVGLNMRFCFGKHAHKKNTEEGGEEKGEEKGEQKGEQKVDASPSVFPAQHSLGLAAHLASAAQ